MQNILHSLRDLEKDCKASKDARDAATIAEIARIRTQVLLLFIHLFDCSQLIILTYFDCSQLTGCRKTEASAEFAHQGTLAEREG